jgi:hypothetical protein
MSTPMVPSYRSGLQRQHNTSLSPVRPRVSVPCSFDPQGGFLVRPCGLRLLSVSLLLLCPLLTSPMGSGSITLPSAISDGPWKTSRGQTQNFLRVGAGCIQHAPIANGGLRGHVPTRPARTTPPLQFLCVAPRVWMGLPSDPASRRRPSPAPRRRLREHLARGLSPRSFCAMPGTHAALSRALWRVGSSPWLGSWPPVSGTRGSEFSRPYTLVR